MTGGSVTKPPMLAVLCPSVPRLERGQVAKAGVCRSAGRGVNSIAQRKEISLSKMTLQIPAKTLAYNRLLLLWRTRQPTGTHLHFSGGTPAAQFLKKSRWYDSAYVSLCDPGVVMNVT